MGVQIPFHLFNLVLSFPLDIFPEVELRDHIVILFLTFERPQYSSMVAVPFYNSTNSA